WDSPWEWAPELGGNLWRTTGDIEAKWQSIYDILEQQKGLYSYAGPGHWNDPDMLEVGNGKLSLAENRTHFSMWAMLASPLLAGNDLPHMKPEIKAILTNKDVIAINQDPLAAPCRAIRTAGDLQIFAKPLADGGTAVAFLNRSATAVDTQLPLTDLSLPTSPKESRDLWTSQTTPIQNNTLTPHIPPHAVVLLRLK
ncbi:MAG TPA: glycoside hydrolase family 27 protein, partial [Isosphaeraceae bacterium]|nr:glycoside hydrolase family 27 protein [Isosphaeraceae bacterium]